MTNAGKRSKYIARVTRGTGFMPRQSRSCVSTQEAEFRAAMERRKDRILAERVGVESPLIPGPDEIRQAQRNLDISPAARRWFNKQKRIADFLVAQPDAYVEQMLSLLTPGNFYCQICPHCAGRLSQESGPPAGRAFLWDYRRPEEVRCGACRHAYPDARYPETGRLVCPRTKQEFTSYLNRREQRQASDHSGWLAYHWARHPVHMSFSGLVRYFRARFMWDTVENLALVYCLSGNSRYGHRAAQMLDRMARCYRRWLYHDYWDTIADCDPLYAAWHDKALPLEWKRNLAELSFAADTSRRAAMLQSYWGAGRLHSSIDVSDGQLISVCRGYGMLRMAEQLHRHMILDSATRRRIERDLFLEAVMTAEPFLGGRGKATNLSNLAINTYETMAVVAGCLGLPEWARTARRGYAAVRDQQICLDGFSKETPTYNNRYLKGLVGIAEALHGFPGLDPVTAESRAGPSGVQRDRPKRRHSNLYRTDTMLRRMLLAARDSLQSDGTFLPFSDTFVKDTLWQFVLEIGLSRFPRDFADAAPTLWHGQKLTAYALFHLDMDMLRARSVFRPPEIFFPGWKTAILRHGAGPQAAALGLTLNEPGAHRHRDNLGLYYRDHGHTVLGDLGYVETVNEWIAGSFSHNLVIVDDEEQLFWGSNPATTRRPSLRMMVSTPLLSVVEAESHVYPQCDEYRRLVVLFKGPVGHTFALDIFRVKGGRKHAYRVFSEIAASDRQRGARRFFNLNMPPEPSLPNFGGSMDRKHIFGLRDERHARNPPAGWMAEWRDADGRYRLHCLSSATEVVASNGPGQEFFDRPGRRVRYLDVIHSRDKSLASCFVAIHEPGAPEGRMPIRRAERIPVPAAAGPEALAVRIESAWGDYLVLNNFKTAAEVAGVKFKGQFGVLCRAPNGRRWSLGCGAETLCGKDKGFAGRQAEWSGRITDCRGFTLETAMPRPAQWPAVQKGVTLYVLAGDGRYFTGYPVKCTGTRWIETDRFPPASGVTHFRLPCVVYRHHQG